MEEQKIDPEYINGFEHGYWLQRGNRKELSDIIKRAEHNPQYKFGLEKGSKEAAREKARNRLQNTKDQSQNRDKGMDID